MKTPASQTNQTARNQWALAALLPNGRIIERTAASVGAVSHQLYAELVDAEVDLSGVRYRLTRQGRVVR